MAGGNDVEYKGPNQKKSFGARLHDFGRAVYNPQKGEVFGRNCSSWAKIGLFYIVFYSCLAGFFAAMMAGFFKTLDEKIPTMTGMYSLLKQNPGMGFRPLTHIESTLIMFDTTKVKTYTEQVENIEAFLQDEGYIAKAAESSEPASTVPPAVPGLSYDITRSYGPNNECAYLPDKKEESFSYSIGQPCVLLKLNRVIYWEPELFNVTDEGSEAYEEAKKAIGYAPTDGYIGVSCEGENDGDIDNMGEVSFYPHEGFDASFYPYLNADHYRPPVVFAHFKNLKPGVVVQIWCKLWAKNIKHHKNDKMGSVHFELFIDSTVKSGSNP